MINQFYKSKKGFMPIIIVLIIVAVVAIGGAASYFLIFRGEQATAPASNLQSGLPATQTESSSKSPPQSSAQLIGLWQRIDELGTQFLEFKQNEFCANWSGGTPEKFVCGQYLPYQLDGNKMLVNGSPWAEWKIVNGKLEFKQKNLLDKNVYEKIR